MSTEMLLSMRPDPKRLARDFLRHVQVGYNDLITGDHAADILAKWTLVMTEWQRIWDIENLKLDMLKYSIQPPYMIKKAPDVG